MIKLLNILNEAEIEKCPAATQNIDLNLRNRQKAINEYGYGPLNPNEPNEKFWKAKMDMWKLDTVEEAKEALCGNCAAFDVTTKTLDCIAKGIGNDEGSEDPFDVIDAGKLGYCRFLKFKCAAARTCDAWVVGGPLTDKKTSKPINEIGEGTAPYKWKGPIEGDHEVNYNFETEDGDEYTVHFGESYMPKYEGIPYELEFYVSSPGDTQYQTGAVTNKGKQYRIISTIMDIIPAFVKEYPATMITFTGSDKETSNSNQRDLLYQAYVKKNMGKLPGWKADLSSTTSDNILFRLVGPPMPKMHLQTK